MGRLNKLYRNYTGLLHVNVEKIFKNIQSLSFQERIEILGRIIWYIPGGIHSSKYDELKYLLNKKLFGNIIADIDLDKIVTVKDVALLRQAVEAKETDSKYDVNRDDEVTEEDVAVAKMLTVSEDFDGFVILSKDDSPTAVAVLVSCGLDPDADEVTPRDLKSISALPTVTLSEVKTTSIWGDTTDFSFVEYLTGISEIPDYEFYNAYVTSVEIPGNVVTIGKSAFAHPTNNIPSLSSLTLNEGLTTISAEAFRWQYISGTIIFPSTLETIEKTAFGYMNGEIDYMYFDENVTSIGSQAFMGSTILKIVFSENCKATIDSQAFSSTQTTYLDLGNVTYIGTGSFKQFGQTGDYSATNIGYVTLIMSKSVTTISEDAFESNAGQHSATNNFYTYAITLPKTLTRIGEYAFYNLNLLGINYDGTIEDWENVYRAKNWYLQDHLTIDSGLAYISLTYVQCSDGQGSISYNII